MSADRIVEGDIVTVVFCNGDTMPDVKVLNVACNTGELWRLESDDGLHCINPCSSNLEQIFRAKKDEKGAVNGPG